MQAGKDINFQITVYFDHQIKFDIY